MSASDWLASTILLSSRRTSAMPVGAEWNACWKRRRACSSATELRCRSVTSRRITTRAPSASDERCSVASVRCGAPAASTSANTGRCAVALSPTARSQRSVTVLRSSSPIRPRNDRPTRSSIDRPVNAAARALAVTITPCSSSPITASGRSSSSWRSSARVRDNSSIEPRVRRPKYRASTSMAMMATIAMTPTAMSAPACPCTGHHGR